MLKNISKKVWIGIGVALVLIVAVVIIFVIKKENQDVYRSITVYEVNGDAKVQRDEMDIIEAYADMKLQSRDIVNTYEESYLQLKLDEDKYILLEPHTKIHLEATGSSADSKTKIYLEEGAIVNCVRNALGEKATYEVYTSNSTMAIRGTTFRVETYEVDGITYTSLSVYEGLVGCQLIFPDGTLDEEVFIQAGKEVNIIGNDETTEYEGEEETVIYETLRLKVLEFLKIQLENGVKLSISKEELYSLIENYFKEETQESQAESTESDVTDESTTEMEESYSQENSTEPAATEEITTEAITETTKTMEDETAKTYTVTFMYQGQVFASQKVEEGQLVHKPKLRPEQEGDWAYDFQATISGDVVINWIS